MRRMDPSNREVEIKLRFESPERARALLGRLGARERRPRAFEDNAVYDDGAKTLKRSGRLLRLRRAGDSTLLTYKERPDDATGSRHKVRDEIETPVRDFAAMHEILTRLGYRTVYRYQKYRASYELDGVEVSLDETPLGCFVELEGAPEAIDRVAVRLGCGPESYITLTYRELQREAAGPDAELGDLLLERARHP